MYIITGPHPWRGPISPNNIQGILPLSTEIETDWEHDMLHCAISRDPFKPKAHIMQRALEDVGGNDSVVVGWTELRNDHGPWRLGSVVGYSTKLGLMDFYLFLICWI